MTFFFQHLQVFLCGNTGIHYYGWLYRARISTEGFYGVRQCQRLINIPLVYLAVFYKPFPVYHQRQRYQPGIAALLLAASELRYRAIRLPAFKIGIGQVVKNNFIRKIK